MVTNGFFGAAPHHAVLQQLVRAAPFRLQQMPVGSTKQAESHIDWVGDARAAMLLAAGN